MSIESGKRYTITNEENGLAFDLYDTHDNSIIGYAFHGAENQQVTAFAFECDNLSLIQPRYPPVDHGEAGRRSMDYSISQAPEVPRIREYPERWNTSLRPRQASALGHRGSIR
jgi:hypothetical protein